MVRHPTGSSRPKESLIDVVVMALYPKIFSTLSGFLVFLLTPIRASVSEGSLGHRKKSESTRTEKESI